MTKEEQIVKDIRELVDKYWSFDNNQIHTHSWHDKQDCLEQIDLYLASHSTEQENSMERM